MVELWTSAENRVKGCPHAIFQNFKTEEDAYDWIRRNAPEAKVFDAESARALHETVPLDETNLDNPHVHISARARASGGGLIWFQDDDAALLLCRQLHTVGHPNFLPARERAAAMGKINNERNGPAPHSGPNDNSNMNSNDDSDLNSNTRGSTDSEDEEEMIESQVEAHPPDATPAKRRRPNSPGAPVASISTPATRNYNPKSDTHLILFTVAPFTTASEFKYLLLEWFITDPKQLGYVRLVKKRGDTDGSFLVAEVFDSTLGQTIIESLKSNDYCHVPLCPDWIPSTSWSHFYTIYTKKSTHDELDQLATSTMVQRLKQECPTSHHKQFDELLCSTSDSSSIMETYQSWFGLTAFSPFGTIENSNF